MSRSSAPPFVPEKAFRSTCRQVINIKTFIKKTYAPLKKGSKFLQADFEDSMSHGSDEPTQMIAACVTTIDTLFVGSIVAIRRLSFEEEYQRVYRICTSHKMHVNKMMACVRARVRARIAFVSSAVRRDFICTRICDIFMFYENTIRVRTGATPIREWYGELSKQVSPWTRVVKLLPHLTRFSRLYLASITPGGAIYLAHHLEFEKTRSLLSIK